MEDIAAAPVCWKVFCVMAEAMGCGEEYEETVRNEGAYVGCICPCGTAGIMLAIVAPLAAAVEADVVPVSGIFGTGRETADLEANAVSGLMGFDCWLDE